MNDTTDPSSRTASIIQILCDTEGSDVVLRFRDALSVPSKKYDGRNYESDTVGKATLNATIQHADVEEPEGVLMCSARVDMDELERVGIDPSVVYTEPRDGPPEYCVVDIRAGRELPPPESDHTAGEIEQAIEEGRKDEVLEPWDGLPTVVVSVERTARCKERHYESDFHVQYSSPEHEIGELIDVRIK